jgi:hypothetical protein
MSDAMKTAKKCKLEPAVKEEGEGEAKTTEAKEKTDDGWYFYSVEQGQDRARDGLRSTT